MHGLEILAIMRESPPLSDGSFVINFPNSLHQGVVERYLTNHNTLLFGLLGLVSRLKADLLHPPMVKRGYGHGREIIPLHGIRELRGGFRQSLHEGKQV